MLIASHLEASLIEKIAGTDSRVRLLHAPALLPRPRWVSDHVGVQRDLTITQHNTWSAMLKDAEVMFDFDWRRPDRTLRQSPALRWIQAPVAGVAQRIAEYGLANSPLLITTAAGVHADPLAEFALAGILYFARSLPQLMDDRRARCWRPGPSSQLAGRKAVIVGAGKVGTRVAELLAAFGVRSTAVVRTPRPAEPPFHDAVHSADLLPALPSADIVVLACPLTDQTRGLIGRRQLDALPAGAIVVNLSHGSVVDEDALVGSLRQGHLGGAVLDGVSREPLLGGAPLWSVDNLILSPHRASNVPSENTKIVDLFIDNLTRYLAGEPLLNAFDPARGY